MVQSMSNKSARYEPPQLPDYLAKTYELKPIVGVPADEDVKSIHAVIRAVNSVSHIPALNSLSLSVRLTQHLFNVQMAVYRSAYPLGLFPGDYTYTPPALPSHISVSLEPVVGSPSDEQLMSAYDATRELDHFARVPSMFDPEVSMKLSQHLFNIQLARHIQESAQGFFTSAPIQAHADENDGQAEPFATGDMVLGSDKAVNTSSILDSAGLSNPLGKRPGSMVPPDTTHEEMSLPETTSCLLEIGATLRNINTVLISIQHSSVKTTADYMSCALVNQRGELPSKHGLPPLYSSYGWSRSKADGGCYSYLRTTGGSELTDEQLAACLRFYDIGTDLIETQGSELTIVSDKKQDAEQVLYKHLQQYPGSS